jgi:hypothetical protein
VDRGAGGARNRTLPSLVDYARVSQMDLPDYFRMLAHYDRLANERLCGGCSQLK